MTTPQQARARLQEAKYRNWKLPQVINYPSEPLETGHQQHLVLKHPGGRTLLQRLSSATSHDQQTALNKSIRAGTALKDKLFLHGKHTKGGDRLGSEQYNIGIWWNMGQYGWTGEHSKNEQYVNPLWTWLYSHSAHFVEPLESLLEEDFRASMRARASSTLDYLQNLVGKESVEVLRPWWSSATVIKGITSGAHQDNKDVQPSMLLNFGLPVTLCVRLEGQETFRLQLLPGQVVFFDAEVLEHWIEGEDKDKQRWGVALFMRKAWTGGWMMASKNRELKQLPTVKPIKVRKARRVV